MLFAAHDQSGVTREGIRVDIVDIWGVRDFVEGFEEGLDPVGSGNVCGVLRGI